MLLFFKSITLFF